jgi:hypothetical protein
MFTEDSILLRNYFLPRMTLKNSMELQSIYDFFKSISIHPITVKSIDTIDVEKTDINVSRGAGADNIIKKTYLFAKTSFHFTLKKCNIKIHLFSEHTNKPLIHELAKIVQYVFSLSRNDLSHLILNIYLIDKKKTSTPGMKTLGRNEINSGMCQRGAVTTITIYREEELMKVLIHELIHGFQYDNYEDTDKIIKHYHKKYHMSSTRINTNEAYTELWANLINCYLISQKPGRNNYQLFLILIALEKEFAKFQAEKVMYLTGLDGKEGVDINKDTNVLSYYIIRNELYEKINLFLKFCKNHNEDYIKLKDENEWFKFLMKNDKMKKNNRRFNNTDKLNYIFTTMRMSLNEVDIYAVAKTPSLLG